MSRITRYQGAIIREHHILLIKHTQHASGRSYWLVPGGGIEQHETGEACVQREMREETGLHVQVLGLLLDEPGHAGDVYQRHKTYLCAVISGAARPGYEPEAEAAAQYAITEVGWFDLRDPATWNEQIHGDAITSSLLHRIRVRLGYALAGGNNQAEG